MASFACDPETLLWDVLAVPAAAGECTELTAFAAFSVLSETASFASTARW